MKNPDVSLFNDIETYCLAFAVSHHGSQLRKYKEEPYWHHLVNVATLVKEYGHSTEMVCAALLHDILEDTKCEESDLTDFLLGIEDSHITNIGFAFVVSDTVVCLTDRYTKLNYPIFNRKQRKRMEAVRLGECNKDVQTIKYCDLIDNTSSIVAHDPKIAQTYLREKAFLLDTMLLGDVQLRKRALLQVSLHKH